MNSRTLQQGSTDRFEILFLCRENLCRSRIAEEIASRVIEQRWASTPDRAPSVRSAGTQATGVSTVHPMVREALRARGIAITGKPTQRLTEPLIQSADLILTATRRQRSTAVTILPSAVNRIFTMSDFAQLCDAGALYTGVHCVNSGWELIDLAVAGRPRVTSSRARADIEDPTGDPVSYQNCVEEISAIVDSILNHLCD